MVSVLLLIATVFVPVYAVVHPYAHFTPAGTPSTVTVTISFLPRASTTVSLSILEPSYVALMETPETLAPATAEKRMVSLVVAAATALAEHNSHRIICKNCFIT